MISSGRWWPEISTLCKFWSYVQDMEDASISVSFLSLPQWEFTSLGVKCKEKPQKRWCGCNVALAGPPSILGVSPSQSASYCLVSFMFWGLLPSLSLPHTPKRLGRSSTSMRSQLIQSQIKSWGLHPAPEPYDWHPSLECRGKVTPNCYSCQ